MSQNTFNTNSHVGRWQILRADLSTLKVLNPKTFMRNEDIPIMNIKLGDKTALCIV